MTTQLSMQAACPHARQTLTPAPGGAPRSLSAARPGLRFDASVPTAARSVAGPHPGTAGWQADAPRLLPWVIGGVTAAVLVWGLASISWIALTH
jgi:hypothetical protein